jgi:ferredoxin
MGHLVGKDLYRQLGKKIDALTVRAPWDDTLFAILKELYSEADAELVVKMPYGLSTIERLERVTKLPRLELERRLETLCPRGLVLDLEVGGRTYYAPSPLVIGIFEFTMMRAGEGLDRGKLARLFDEYLHDGSFMAANFAMGQRVSIMRALPHEGAIAEEDYVEVLDYEKATAIVESHRRFAMGTCSCRHERQHLGSRQPHAHGAAPCSAPLDNCSALGDDSVGFLVRNGLAREVSKTEMLENVSRSRELGLVLNADNVQRHVSFLCHCCGCCCNVLRGITRDGFPNAVVTSSYTAACDAQKCTGCGVCSRKCPVNAIARVEDPDPRFRKFGRPRVDKSFCIGCGVCAVKCNSGAMRLHSRRQRVLHPATTFERNILQCLERGTLQNQLFDDPSSKTQAFLRGLVGGFLRLAPVKQALMSDVLRSRFLAAMTMGATALGKGSFTEL